MRFVMLVFGCLLAVASAVITSVCCDKVPQNLRSYYRPGYIVLGVTGIVAGIAIALLSLL